MKVLDVAEEANIKYILCSRKLFDVVSSLGPTDYNTLHTILAMATYGEDPTLGRPTIQNIQPIKVIFCSFVLLQNVCRLKSLSQPLF